MSEKYTADELERWAQSLPRRGTPEIPKESMARVSAHVAQTIARGGNRRIHWQNRWQPALAAGLTVVVALWIMTGTSARLQTHTSVPQHDGLLAALAPTVADSTLAGISSDDIDALLSDDSATLPPHTDIVKAVGSIEFDADNAVATMTPAQQQAVLHDISSDQKLDWSELL